MGSPATISRRFEFDAGHRVMRHESKCANLHGHRYVAEVSVQSPQLDSLGRVVDFGELKSLVGGWIDANWDHNVLLNSLDPLYSIWLDSGACVRQKLFGPKVPYTFANQNPTAEIMVERLFCVVYQLLAHTPLEVTAVRLYETPNCWADYTLEQFATK